MSYKQSNKKILELLCTNYPYVHIVAEDDNKAILGIKETIETGINFSQNEKFDVITWNPSYGISKEIEVNLFLPNNNKIEIESDATKQKKFKQLFEYIKNYNSNAVFIIQEIDSCYADEELTYELKELITSISSSINKNEKKLRRFENGKKTIKMIYALSDKVSIPDKLNKLTTVAEYNLPGKEDLLKILEMFASERKLASEKKELNKIAEAGIGLTEFEFSNAVFNSYMKNNGRKIDVMEVSSLKEQIVKKGGILEFSKSNINMEDVGGLENLMDWVKKREIAFDENIRETRKLQFPKGILLTGIPGCGKSESVKAIASHLKLPLLRLDTGSLMGKYVGDTETNTRKAIGLAESLAPAILWIDEIEKSFPDPRSSGTHEVSNRLMSFFLTWLQEKTSEVFVVATANNIDKLPPELLRKGRFSEIFFVNLPKPIERNKIFKIHLNKIDVTLGEADIERAVNESEGFSGAEIAEVVQESNFQSAFENSPLTIDYLLAEIKKATPLSVIMGEKLTEIERWATQNKVRPASI